MRPELLIAGLLCGLMLAIAGTHRAGAEDKNTWIEINRNNGFIDIIPVFLAKDPGIYSYAMTVTKEGASGRSKNLQQGFFEPQIGVMHPLARVSLSIKSGDWYQIDVTINKDGKTAGKAHVEVSPNT